MKERIIHEVLQDMVLYLNNEQLEMLKRTMNCIFEDIEVIKTDKQITQTECNIRLPWSLSTTCEESFQRFSVGLKTKGTYLMPELN